MSPLPSGNIAPALLVPLIANQTVLLPGAGGPGFTAFAPTVDNVGFVAPLTFPDEISDMLGLGSTSTTSTPDKTIDRSEFGTPAVGDILIAMSCTPGYAGSSALQLRSPSNAFWENLSEGMLHFATDTSKFVGGIFVREATGTAEDTCKVTGIGPFPTATQICRIGGNFFTGNLDTLFVQGKSDEDLTDVAGARAEGTLFGGVNNCIEFMVSWKRGDEIETTDALIKPASSRYIELGAATGLDNGFGDAMQAIWGWNYSIDSGDGFQDSDCTGADYEDASFTVALRHRTDDS